MLERCLAFKIICMWRSKEGFIRSFFREDRTLKTAIAGFSFTLSVLFLLLSLFLSPIPTSQKTVTLAVWVLATVIIISSSLPTTKKLLALVFFTGLFAYLVVVLSLFG